MNPRFSIPNVTLFPPGLSGIIITVEPGIRIAFGGTSWEGKFQTVCPAHLELGQTCQVLGREGITLLIAVN